MQNAMGFLRCAPICGEPPPTEGDSLRRLIVFDGAERNRGKRPSASAGCGTQRMVQSFPLASSEPVRLRGSERPTTGALGISRSVKCASDIIEQTD